jgi:hypothetical protein
MTLCTRKNWLSQVSRGQKFFFKTLVLLLLCLSTITAHADWWTQSSRGGLDAPGSYFKNSFNPSDGTLSIQSWAYNGGYHQFGCCLFYAVYVESAVMYYQLEGSTNYIPFYWWGFNYENQNINSNFSPHSTTRSTFKNSKGDLLLNMKLTLTDNIKNIKRIKIKARMVAQDAFYWGGPQDIEDVKDVSITQMTAINRPTYEFAPVQNSSGVYEPKAKFSYTKPPLNVLDNISTMVLNERVAPPVQNSNSR